MENILEIVQEYFRSEDWHFEKDTESQTIRAGISCDNARFRVTAHANDETHLLIIFVESPNDIPEAFRYAMCEFITRANVGMIIGNFEMGMEDGELRYKVSADVEGGRLSQTMVENMIGVGVHTMDTYYPGIMAMLYADKSAKDAIELVEEHDDKEEKEEE